MALTRRQGAGKARSSRLSPHPFAPNPQHPVQPVLVLLRPLGPFWVACGHHASCQTQEHAAVGPACPRLRALTPTCCVLLLRRVCVVARCVGRAHTGTMAPKAAEKAPAKAPAKKTTDAKKKKKVRSWPRGLATAPPWLRGSFPPVARCVCGADRRAAAFAVLCRCPRRRPTRSTSTRC
jgi:hypothetical protein